MSSMRPTRRLSRAQGREDDLVPFDVLPPAAFELAAAGDVVRLGGEALGVGGGVQPAVEHPAVQRPDMCLVAVHLADRYQVGRRIVGGGWSLGGGGRGG